MFQWFTRFPEFIEFNEISAPFRKNSINIFENFNLASSKFSPNLEKNLIAFDKLFITLEWLFHKKTRHVVSVSL